MCFFPKPTIPSTPAADLDTCKTCPPHLGDDNSTITPGPAIPTPQVDPPPSPPPDDLLSGLPTYPVNASASFPSTSRRATASTWFGPNSLIDSSTPRVEHSTTAAKLKALLEKYDPRSKNVPELWPMNEHRDMIRTMFLNNILYATARLHRHNWILGAGNEMYKELCGTERWDLIHEDLEIYTKSIKDYEFWLTSFIQRQEIERTALPPTYQFYGRTLALLELASHPATASRLLPCEKEMLNSLEHSFVADNHTWSQANAIARRQRYSLLNRHHRRKGLISRVLMATFGGSTLIIPMIIMTFDTRLVTTLLTTSIFTLAIGLILAFWMDDADNKDIIGATAAYAAVLVVFVGTEGRSGDH